MGRLAVLALLALALTGCGAAEPAAETPATTSHAEGSHDFAGVGLDGETISLGDFRGRPVLVNVWSSW